MGRAMDISGSGNRIAFSHGNNPAVVKVYEWNGSVWNQMGSNIAGYASVLSLNHAGDKLAIGDDFGGTNSVGTVSIYSYVNGGWNLDVTFSGQNNSDQFGASIGLNAAGDKVVISSIGHDGNGFNIGKVLVYGFVGNAWIQLGNSFFGQPVQAYQLGNSVSINGAGDVIAIGTVRDNSNTGKVQIYKWDNTLPGWVQRGSDMVGDATGNTFGASFH